MAQDISAMIEAGLALDLDERAVLANALLNSLHESNDDEPREVDAAWSAEIESRFDEVIAGEVALVDADEHYARLRAELAARRK